MPIWLQLVLLALVLLAGVFIGILLQQRRAPGRLLRSLTAAGSDLRTKGVQLQRETIPLEVKSFKQASSWTGTSSELDAKRDVCLLTVSPSEIALVLIDVWEDHPNQGWAERAELNIQGKLLPLLISARQHGIVVVHCPNGQEVHHLVKPLRTELVIQSRGHQTRFVKTLRQLRIKHLLYAGYASNMCVLTRPTGIIEMAKAGFNIILVRDASLALESPELVAGELTHKAVTYMVETNWGVTTKVNEIISALDRRPFGHQRFQPTDHPIRHPETVSGTHRDNPT